MPPHFCPAPALLDCEKSILRWPGPFGSGFLSPQPPGAVGIGPVRRGVKSSTLGQRKLVLFVFGIPSPASFPRARETSEAGSQNYLAGQIRRAGFRARAYARPGQTPALSPPTSPP